MKGILFFIFLSNLILAQETGNLSNIELDSAIIFPNNSREKSISIFEKVNKNLNKNYAFYGGVNYEIDYHFKNRNCSETMKLEVSYKSLLNSSVQFLEYNPSGCIAKEQDTIKTLALLIPINLKWMKNWGGAFTKNQIQKAKYGKLSETETDYDLVIRTEDYEKSYFRVDKDNYALTSLSAGRPVDKFGKDIFGLNCNYYEMTFQYQKSGSKYHPKSILLTCNDDTEIRFDFMKVKKKEKLKKKKNGMNLLKINNFTFDQLENFGK